MVALNLGAAAAVVGGAEANHLVLTRNDYPEKMVAAEVLHLANTRNDENTDQVEVHLQANANMIQNGMAAKTTNKKVVLEVRELAEVEVQVHRRQSATAVPRVEQVVEHFLERQAADHYLSNEVLGLLAPNSQAVEHCPSKEAGVLLTSS